MGVRSVLLPGVTLSKSVLCVPSVCCFALTPVLLQHCGLPEKWAGKPMWGAWPPVPAHQLPQDELPLGDPSILGLSKETVVSDDT